MDAHQDNLFELRPVFDAATRPHSAAELKEFGRALARMPRLGAYNAWLVQVQRPGSAFVDTEEGWAKRGRRVKPMAHRLITLRPFGPVEFVYELADTEGEPVPERFAHPFAAEGSVTEEGYRWFVRRLGQLSIVYDERQQGSQLAAHVTVHDVVERETRDGRVRPLVRYAVTVNSLLGPNEKFRALIHEVGHVQCGHLIVPMEMRIRQRPGLSEESKELEAECVAWLLCRRLGVRYDPSEHLRSVLDGARQLPPVDLERISRAVNEVEKLGPGLVNLGHQLRREQPSPEERRTGRLAPEFEEPTLFD